MGTSDGLDRSVLHFAHDEMSRFFLALGSPLPLIKYLLIPVGDAPNSFSVCQLNGICFVYLYGSVRATVSNKNAGKTIRDYLASFSLPYLLVALAFREVAAQLVKQF
jgi:hypothetical protein